MISLNHILLAIKYRILGYFDVVIFSPLVVTWQKINTIVCSGDCDKHVSFLCVVFVSEKYSRELRIYFCVYKLSFLGILV